VKMSNEEKLWFKSRGCEMLRELGIEEHSRVVDFGSGKGRYTVPLSQAVGEKGHVHSVERDENEISVMRERLKSYGSENVVTVIRGEDLLLESIKDGSIDVVLAFDVLQYVDDWKALFLTLKRILKADGSVHIYPAAVPHPGSVDMKRVTSEMVGAGFSSDGNREFRMMHNKDHVTDRIYSFSPVKI
jgi:tRNA A58 N-methylase Trm61